jgi:hypothetical protein
MFLAVLNKATGLTNDDCQKAVAACATQLKLHVAPIWDMVPASVVFYDSEDQVPAGADLLVIMDDPDQARAMGYHQITPAGQPYARVFARPILDHGGTPTTGTVSIAATMSHEVCEWFADRFVNLWAQGPKGQYPLEICDPVEDDTYEIDGVTVSNFVTKRYFDQNAPDGTQFDYLNKLTKPFTFTPGGYTILRQAGSTTSVFGARYPDWRRETKDFPAARSSRRCDPA